MSSHFRHPRSTRSTRTRRTPVLQFLETRRLFAATLDVVAGALTYNGSAVNNNLSVSLSGGTYTFNDTGETITLGAGAIGAGATGNGTNTVTIANANVNSIAIDTDSGNDVVNLKSIDDPTSNDTAIGVPDTLNIGNAGNVDGVNGNISAGDSGGVGNITINDQNNSNAKTWNFTNNVISGTLPNAHTITLNTGITQMDVNGGFGGNTFNLNMTSATNLTTLNVNSGDASDNVNVQAIPVNLTLNVNTQIGGGDATTIGNAGNVDGVLGFVSVTDSGGVSSLTIDDSANTTAKVWNIATGSVSGATPNPISFGSGVTTLTLNLGLDADTANVNISASSDLGTLNVNGGGSNDIVNILATPSNLTTNVNTQNGTGDATNIGNAGNVDGVLGFVSVTDSGGGSTLTIDDSANVNAKVWNVSLGTVSGATPNTISFGSGVTTLTLKLGQNSDTANVNIAAQSDLDTLNLNGGLSSDNLNILATPSDLTTNVDTQNGIPDNTNIGNAGSTAGILGPVHVSDSGGVGNLSIDDSLSGTTRNVVINNGTITGAAPATITYGAGIVGLTVSTSTGNDTFVFTQSTISSLSSVVLNGNDGGDFFNITPSPGAVVTVNGGNPVAPTSNPDVLLINPAGATGTTQHVLTPDSGFFTFGNRQNVNYTGIEDAGADHNVLCNLVKLMGLPKGHQTALLAKCDLKGNNGDKGKLGAFISFVGVLQAQGQLNATQAALLTAVAQALLLSI